MKRYLPGIVLVAGLIFRGWNLLVNPVWYDEAFTLLVARLPLASMLAALAGDVHPPLHYFLIAVLLRVFPSAAPTLVIRGFSLLLGLASLLVFHRVTGLIGLVPAGRVAALAMLTWLPSEIFYQQEGRMYALLQLLTLAQVLFMLKRRWVALGVTTLLALYTHNYSLIYTAALGGAGLLFMGKNTFRGLILALGGAGLGWLPWVGVLLHQMGNVAKSYWIQPFTAGGLLVAITQIWGGISIPGAWLVALVLCLGVLLALVIHHGIKHQRYFLLVWLLLPLALVALVSSLYRSILLFRGFYPGLPALAALAGECFSLARPGAARWGRWALLLPWLAVLLWQHGLNTLGLGKNWAVWPATSPAPVIVHLEDTSYITGRVLWPKSQQYLLSAGCPPEQGALTEETRLALGYQYISLAMLPSGAVLAGALGPLATACHYRIYTQLTSTSRALFLQKNAFGEYGIWSLK